VNVHEADWRAGHGLRVAICLPNRHPHGLVASRHACKVKRMNVLGDWRSSGIGIIAETLGNTFMGRI
jgi:hypothetical protein